MPQNLQGTSSEPTNKKPTNMLEVSDPKNYVGTPEELDTLQFVLNRFSQMQSRRTQMDRFWQMYQMQFESLYVPYTDWRSRSNVPLEWAIIELFVSEAITRKSVPTFKAIWESDIVKEEIIKRVWDYDFNRNDREDELYKAEYLTAIFWTSFYFNGFESKSRVIQDPDIVNWQLVWVNKMLTENNILLETLDIRNVYFDERITNYKNANDCIFLEYITPEQLKQFENDTFWGWKNLDSVWTTTKANQAFWTNEERWMNNTGLIEICHYWNKQSDKYVVIANRAVEIKNTFIPYSHKSLPITPRQYAYNPLSLYGRWLAEALLSFKSEINTLKEMIMDWIKRSNNSTFAIWGWLTFDWESFGFNNTLVKFEWQLNDRNFRELSGKEPNAAVFNYLQELLKEIAIFVGIDPMAITWQGSDTAFQTAVQQESSLKRINVVLGNRDMALKHVFRKHLQNIMQYFPIKTAKWLVEVDTEWKKKRPQEEWYPTIILEWEKYVNWEFVQFNWKFPFEVKPEYIRWEIDIDVSTNFNAPTLKQLKKDNMAQFVKFVNDITLAVQQNPAVGQIIKVDDLIKEAAFDYDIDLSSIWGQKDWVQKDKKELLDMVKKMAWVHNPDDMWFLWGPASWWWQTPHTPPIGWETSSAGWMAQWWVAGVNTPNTPLVPNIQDIWQNLQ